MKKTLIVAFVAFLTLNGSGLLAMNSAETMAEKNMVVDSEKEHYTAQDIRLIAERVNEIKEMDHSGISSEVRKSLRYELVKYRDIIQQLDPYIYIGGGGLLLLIIILILIF